MEKPKEVNQVHEEAVAYFKQAKLKNDLEYASKLHERFAFFEAVALKSPLESFDITQTYTMTATQTEFSYQCQLKYLLKLAEQLAAIHGDGSSFVQDYIFSH